MVGDRVRITRDVTVLSGTFTAGHRFRVIRSGPRGLDLEDENGNLLCDTIMIDQSIVPDKNY